MRFILRLIKSFGVWYVYGPHVSFLRLIGPRAAILLCRGITYVHWCLTLVGSHKRAANCLRRTLPAIHPGLSLNTALKRYLEVKHQGFAEWYCYQTERGRRFVRKTYQGATGLEHLDQAREAGKGAILLVYHYGLAKMVWPALRELGYDTHHHVFRGATYAGETFDKVAKAAMDALTRSEQVSGLSVIYHRPFFTFQQIIRYLEHNELVGMNGDGMMGTDFVDVPFLDGHMKFPRGVARVAATAGAPIIPVFAMHEGLTRHRLELHEPIYCAEDTPEAVNACVATCTDVLDEYVRKYPWAWWTWRRLDTEETADGSLRFEAIALCAEKGIKYTPVAGAAPARRRVAREPSERPECGAGVDNAERVPLTGEVQSS